MLLRFWTYRYIIAFVMITTMVILAGGKATRLYPLTETIPKSMLSLAGKPFIAHQMELIKRNDFQHVVICTGHLGHMIIDYVRKENDTVLSVDFSIDGDKPLGTAGAIKKALPYLENNFSVMYGDSYLTDDFRPIADFFLKSGKKGLMTVFKNEGRWDFSNIFYKDGEIVKYDKNHLTQDMKHIDYGLLFFKKEAFAEILDQQTHDLADLCRDLVNEGQMAGYEVKQRFYEIGSIKGLEETRRYLQKLN